MFKLFFFLGLFLAGKVQAQEIIPTYSDYLTDNLYLLHPSMAGASNLNKVRLTARQQWFAVEDAPGLQTLNVHARVREKIGAGGIVFNDHNGNFSKRGIYGTFAYHLLLSRSELDLNQLSFGISGGLIQHSLDQRGFYGYDPMIDQTSLSDFYGNMDVGISYYYFNFFAHLTAKNIIAGHRELFISDAVPGNQRTYLFSSGYIINPLHSPYGFEPSLLFQWREQSGEKSLDANVKVYRNMESGNLFAGLSYRRSFEGADSATEAAFVRNQQLQYVTPFAGIEYKNFLFAYTYSHQFNAIILSNGGFHQLTLGYNFGKDRKRYDCGCHHINHRWH